MLERGSFPGSGRRTTETRRVEKRLQPRAPAQCFGRSHAGRIRQRGHATFLCPFRSGKGKGPHPRGRLCCEVQVSYFRLQKAGKIGPRTVHSFSDSTSRLSQNAGQVTACLSQLQNCLVFGFWVSWVKLSG